VTEPVERPEDLTPAWLSSALRLPVQAVDFEPIGTGQTGASYRLTLRGDGVPGTVVAKLPAPDPALRTAVRNGYRAEVGFYRHLAGSTAVRTPACSYAGISGDGTIFTLLLEDLAPRRPGIQAEGCSVEQATPAVDNLAALHAAHWNDDTVFDHGFLARPSEGGADFLGSYAVRATDAFVERYGDDLTEDDVETLLAAAEGMRAWLLARAAPFAALHGDYRLDNLLFPPDGDDVVVVDWQTMTVGLPGRDLGYFLGTSLHIDDRRRSEDDLVARYHARLVHSGVTDYGLDRCIDDYRFGQLQGPFITTIGSANAVARDSGADAMFLAMARRSCAAIRDLGSLDLI
jgi:hypothetical protein